MYISISPVTLTSGKLVTVYFFEKTRNLVPRCVSFRRDHRIFTQRMRQIMFSESKTTAELDRI